MKQILILLVAVVAVSCSCSAEREAEQKGQEAAQAIIASRPESDMAFQEMLLNVRSEEYKYRSQGRNDDADAYIKGFTEYMIGHNDSIAQLLKLSVD